MHNSVCCLCLQHKDSSAVDTDNWFKTGDVSSIDSLGFMRITDRSKDVIKSGGEWISSIDIENAAMSHEHVSIPPAQRVFLHTQFPPLTLRILQYLVKHASIPLA